MFDLKKYAKYTTAELMLMGYGALGIMAIVWPGRFSRKVIPNGDLGKAAHRASRELRLMFHRSPSSVCVAKRGKSKYKKIISLHHSRDENLESLLEGP